MNTRAQFVETADFSKWRTNFLSKDAYAAIRQQLVANPQLGKVMPGCGGLRKMRIADPKRNKGKRGGARMIYLHIPEANLYLLLDVYGKDEQEDLSPSDKKSFRNLASEYKKMIIERVRKET
jgi:putative transcriptional regulator